MVADYFTEPQDEIELCSEIKIFLEEVILKETGDFFLLLEFDAFDLTIREAFKFTSQYEFDNFIDKREATNPRLVVAKTDSLFAEFNGQEIEVNFEMNGEEVVPNLWRTRSSKKYA
jgi:hypothetical protein